MTPKSRLPVVTLTSLLAWRTGTFPGWSSYWGLGPEAVAQLQHFGTHDSWFEE